MQRYGEEYRSQPAKCEVMQDRHLPSLGPRFWAALCLASIFGANMGDYFAHDIGLGHVAGLPFLAAAFVLVLVIERFDPAAHDGWYWLAIILVRTAATNLGDFFTMQDRHLPSLGSRFWAALCLASIFGANMGDYFAHDIGLGHVAGLPFLAAAFAFVLVIERFEPAAHDGWYWLAIILVRTAATNLGDFFAGDLRLPRPWVMAGLVVIMAKKSPRLVAAVRTRMIASQYQPSCAAGSKRSITQHEGEGRTAAPRQWPRPISWAK